MVNKYRKKQAVAPYRKFQGNGQDQQPDQEGQLVYLGRGVAKKVHHIQAVPSPVIPFKLPMELLHWIVSYIDPEDAVSLLTVSKVWHVAALPVIYKAPQLSPRNLAKFVETINARKDLGLLVQDLDLRRTIQTGKNSWTAKVLRKCSTNLLRFVAGQTHFGYSPIIALQSCKQLRILDLAYVSDTVELPQLLKAIMSSEDLEVVRFPKNTTEDTLDSFFWPVNVHSIALSGSMPAEFLKRHKLPSRLTSLEFQNCTKFTSGFVWECLQSVGQQLTTLSVIYPMPLLKHNCMDLVLVSCRKLTTLNVSIDFVSCMLFDEQIAGHPLQRFYIHASGGIGLTEKLKPEDIVYALEYLDDLKSVSMSVALGWNSYTDEMVDELALTLEARGGTLRLV